MSDDLSVGTRIDHEKHGEGIVSKVTLTAYEVFFARGGKIQFSYNTPQYSDHWLS